MNYLRTFLLCLITLTFLGCAVATEDTVVISQPVSTVESAIGSAFDDDDPQADIDFGNLPRSIAIIPFGNDTDEPDAATVLRRVLQNHLSTKNYRVMHWKAVDQAVEDLEPAQMDSATALAASLGTEGILRGRVTSYDLLYAGIYAQIKLGVSLSLRNAEGEELWMDELEVTSEGKLRHIKAEINFGSLVLRRDLETDVAAAAVPTDAVREVRAGRAAADTAAAMTFLRKAGDCFSRAMPISVVAL